MTMQEHLAETVGDNFNKYLTTMANSTQYSTKGSIPALIAAHGCKTVLDVGCANGAFTWEIARETGAKVTGIDINPMCIAKAKACGYPEHKVEFVNDELHHVDGKYDCVVFGSVMHEISSYHPTTGFRYTQVPIRKAFQDAEKLLNPGGIIVVRDWLRSNHGSWTRWMQLANHNYLDLYKRFTGLDGKRPAFEPLTHAQEQHIVLGDYKIGDIINDKDVLVDEELFMEFLMVATWGPDSWERERFERRFICTKEEWYGMAEICGMSVDFWLQTTEEYPRYCKKIIKANNRTHWTMPDTTFVMVAKKEEN